MAEEVVLRDGTSAMIWPLLPTDRAGLRAGYQRLSAEAQYHRFLAVVPQLTDRMLHVLVDEVDGVDHVALVIVVLPAGGDTEPVGVARMVRYRDRPYAADVAVTIAEDWRGRGAATALLESLVRHRPAGVKQVVTQIDVDNAASLAMLRHLGPVEVKAAGAGVLEVLVELDVPPDERR